MEGSGFLDSGSSDVVGDDMGELVNKIIWYFKELSLMTCLVTISILLSLTSIFMHYISHRQIRTRAYMRGYRNGRKEITNE